MKKSKRPSVHAELARLRARMTENGQDIESILGLVTLLFARLRKPKSKRR